MNPLNVMTTSHLCKLLALIPASDDVDLTRIAVRIRAELLRRSDDETALRLSREARQGREQARAEMLGHGRSATAEYHQWHESE